ncbi:hypothetical protein GQ457_03G020120 [Hibiscus cannabinus]
MGKPIVLDTQTIATHLGLQNTGLAEESTTFPNLYPPENIDCTVDLSLPLTDPIDEKSLRKCKFHLVNNEWVRNPNPQDDDGDDVQPPQAPLVVAAPPPVDIQALFAQLNANLDARFTAIDARFTTFTDDVNARFNCLNARHNAMETRFKAQEDALRRVETEVSAHHLEWSSHTFGGLGLNDHSDEDEEDNIHPP